MIPLRVEYINPTMPPTDPTKQRSTPMEKNKKLQLQLTKSAMDFASDSLQTNLCLKYSPEKIALTCIYMSAQYCKVRPTEGRKWLEILVSDSTFNLNELACKSLSMFYSLHIFHSLETCVIESFT